MPETITTDLGNLFEGREGRIIDPFEYKETVEGKEVIKEGVIRYATKQDYEGLVKADIDRSEFRHAHYDLDRKKPEDIQKKMMQRLERSFSQPEELAFIVLEINGEIAGYIELDKLPTLPPDVIQTSTVSVLEKYHSKGAGKALVVSTETEIRRMGIKKIELYTNDQNEQTVGSKERVGFYEKLGYEREGEPMENKKGVKWRNKNGEHVVVKHIKFVKYLNVVRE